MIPPRPYPLSRYVLISIIFQFLIFIQADKFTISTSDGTVPEFIGAYAVYAFESAVNFVEISPGATVKVSHQRVSFIISVVPYRLIPSIYCLRIRRRWRV